MTNVAVLAVSVLVAAVLLHPRVATSVGWRAIVTPLASIIGSGFLVIGPILDASFGYYAPVAMALLCILAYAFGTAIRFNILRMDKDTQRSRLEDMLELVASWVLVLAYAISVAYYLNLLGAFSLSLTPYDDPLAARLVTTGALLVIAYTGWTRGFTALEGMEKLAVTLKLAIIAGLLCGLAIYFGATAARGALVFNPPQVTDWAGLTLVFGLIVTVQGFETSRYLGRQYDAHTRIQSMKRAQWIATAIYMVYILLLSFLFASGTIPLSETAIIPLMKVAAPILPVLLVGAALAAQFSAAVADTAGSGGLVAELTRGRVSTRAGYTVLAVIGVVLTWSANVFEIITIASRAFAAYYAIQAANAAAGSLASGHRTAAIAFSCLAALGLLVVVTGASVSV
ncbi:hypothetical protein [Pseudaestuariivita atlantica]|uniref:Membrane protein n=1 Tax=Pseudaestuariivita atlantica TaxID=1317121 RepID=A0A0L1JSD3_9RHOB|nr:hypothetical protein [Pseudaestuariivita atlantica]KNG94612.1 membrane protein [Pseudaestuariivita atlantica]